MSSFLPTISLLTPGSLSSHKRLIAFLFLYKCEAEGIYFFSENHYRVYYMEGMEDRDFAGKLSIYQKRKLRSGARSFIRGVFNHMPSVDSTLSQYASNWSLMRMHAVDRSVLRLSCYELLYKKSPKAVVIHEAVELAKAYGDATSGAFVHGILGAIAHHSSS